MSCVGCTFEELLLELSLGDLNLDCLVNLLVVSALVVGVVLDGGGEEGVDESGLSESGLASNLEKSEIAPVAHALCPRHTIIVKAAPRFATILWLSKVRDTQRGTCASCLPTAGWATARRVSDSLREFAGTGTHIGNANWGC